MSDAHAQHNDHGDHGDHPDFLQHHFESPQQQFEAGKLGMWLFLATEVLLFGGLFVGYAVWRGNNAELFVYGREFLDTAMGATNTAVLILSSLTMALAVTYSQMDKRGPLITCLLLTLLGAAIFMGIKYVEYTDKFREGIYPGMRFYEGPPNIEKSKYWVRGEVVYDEEAIAELRAELEEEADEVRNGPRTIQPALPQAEGSSVLIAAAGERGINPDKLVDERKGRRVKPEKPIHPLQDPTRPANAHMFFNIYFMMTGLHAFHVLVGMIVIGWLAVKAWLGHFSSAYYTPVDLGGLYWHVVDLIWIFLFPLFYL